jgi:hypothetical protein
MHDSLHTLLAHMHSRLISADASISADVPRFSGPATRPRACFADVLPHVAAPLAAITTPVVDAVVLRTLWTASSEISGPFVLEWLNNAMRASSEPVSIMDVNSALKTLPAPFPPISEVRCTRAALASVGCNVLIMSR